MKGYTAKAELDGRKIIVRIEEAPEGFYVFFLSDPDLNCFRDELQPSLEIAKEAVNDIFKITMNAWVNESWDQSYSRPNKSS